MSKADMSNGYRTLSQHLNDLKKENFSLKLRIYFLEERIQQKYDESSEDVYRTNIELKVEVESLKQELQEKQQHLDKALTTAESLTNHNELELQRRCEERQQEIDHMQEVLENKIQLLQEEAQLARCEAERMASLAGSHSHASLLSLDTPMEDMPEDDKPLAALPPPTTNKDRLIEELTKELCSKDALITELSGDKNRLTQRVGELEGQLEDLSSSLLQKDKDVEFYQEELGRERLRIEQEMQSLVEEQQSQLNQYECAAGQCVNELQKAQLQVQSLQAKIHESEANNTKLQEKLTEMECELRSIRQAAQNQERTIQDLTDSVSTKDNEAQELYQLIEGQNATLCKLREMAHRNQLTQSKAAPEGGSQAEALSRLQGELVGVQASLFSLGLELEASQRSLRHSQRTGDDLATAKDRLHSDLQEALSHREQTEKHNQDLHSALQSVRSELQAKEAALKESEAERHAEGQERERSHAQLKRSLQDKERQLQEYSEMLDSADSCKPRDALLEKLRERIKNRDKALERSIDEKFRCLEDKESQVRMLQLALREKDRDLDRLRSILSNNEETITSLDSLVHGKDLQLEQAAEAYRNLQWLKQQSEDKERTALRERDAIVSQLQGALHTRSQEAQDVTAALLSRVQAGPSEVVEELKARLALKEKLFQELLSDRSRQAAEHQAQVQDLLNTIGSKDQYLQDCSDKLAQVIDERTGQLQELRRQLSSVERELSDVRREKEQEREAGGETELLRSRLKEKEAFIKELVQGQEDAMESSCREGEPEVQALQEELCLVLKKERDAQKELSAVRVTLAQVQQQAQQSASEDTEHQCVLEQIVSEYQQLNDALKAEKRLYQNLSHIHTRGESGDSSSEKTQALHTELDSVQALRGQLEEVLARTRDMAMALERAAQRRPDDFGELSTEEDGEDDEEGDDEEGSSDEFTDSIEDDGVKVTARSLASVQSSGMTRGHTGFSGGRGTAAQSQEDAETQLGEAKRTLKLDELEEMRSQLESDGYSSLAQMRSVLLSLQRENQALRESRGRPGGLGQEEENHQEIEEEEVEEDEEDYVEEEGAPPAAVGKRGPPCVKLREGRGKRQCTRPHSLDLGTLLSHRQPQHSDKEGEEESGGGAEVSVSGGFWQHVEEGLRAQAVGLRSDLALCRQENRELQERLMVSEATVHAQAEQLNDYRDLLSETSVQQASKQVQVDLQDLGYETCGRSENEAEREDTSSPEFDDLEMCTSLSNPQDYEGSVVGGGGGGGWYQEDQSSHMEGSYDLEEEEEEEELEEEEQGEGAASLHSVVRDLRSQLSRCHKVIRGLQLRIRSLSATSDYASSLERTPRKVNWAFEAASPAPSGVEEDEGWVSDSLATRTEPKSNRELRELVSRVTSLEAQLKLQGKGLGEEGKCATWPGKYNTLIQAQARELSHLRQRMREGRGVCHILTQHLGDTTKAFEELLRANDIDYYMGQSFREQLAQSTALAQRVGTKISGRDRAEGHDDKAGHELLALRLSKELQQKDKIIESLHSKLQQRPETPSSCHALSETTDQSDRTSMVSDECRTNEDLDLCSDLDAASEYAEPGHGSEQEVYASIPPPPPPPPPVRGLKSSTSCPNMLSSNPVALTNQTLRARLSGPVSCSLPGPLGPDPWGPHVSWEPPPRALSVTAIGQELDSLHRQMNQQHRGFVASRKAMSALTLGGHNQHDLSPYGPLPHHAFQPYQLGVVPECSHSLKSDSGLATGGGALWDMESGAQPVRGYMGSTGQISVNSHGGIDLIEEHLREVRCLRQRLEESIRTNERLRQQLEERLAGTGREGGAPTNIYIQGLDTVTQLSNEIRVLKDENLALQSRLQANSDTCEEVAQLREAVLAGRARLKQAELEAEQWKEELRRLQTHSQEQGQQIHTLRQERQQGQENCNRLQHEASLLQQQLCESRDLIHSLQSELHVYDRVCGAGTKADKGYLCELPAVLPVELGELLGEVRSLRAQLQSSVQENSALKQLELHKQLEQKLGGGGSGPRTPWTDPLGGGSPSPRTPSSLCALTASPQRDHFYRRQLLHDSLDPHSELEGDAPDGSFANRHGRHAIGHVDDFSALQQQVLEGRSLVQRMESTLQGCLSQSLLEANQEQISDLVLDYGCVKSLLSNTKTLRQILEEAVSLLKMFWRAALPSSDRPTHSLLKEQSMQEEILSLRLRMSEQEEVLQGTIQRLRSTSRTKESMEHFIVNQLSRTRDVLKKARTNLEKNEQRLSSLSSSPSCAYADKAEDPRGVTGERPTDWSLLKPADTADIAMATPKQRIAARKRSSQCLLETLTC